ncbi:SpoIIAA family protein [Rufibacter hautae]|uniref:STAS/SEC14 domain-containing protein n=1 Tax=Rufibacter hautae TaxID=2595005 RepID=A0A5B6TKR3_9BACT|nr:STAS/SEC14 domain-containing protein [Rufibacter hautae]KAA3440586.1 STAS/SEC14 domain-containing protein [Rufibacter hautae]
MVTTYFQSRAFTLTYDHQHQLGIAQAVGFLNSEEFREATAMCVRLLEEHKPLRWLADNRRMKAIRQADQQWFHEFAFPKLRDSSIRRNATVVSEDIFNKMAIEQLMKRAPDLGDMLLHDFESREEALAWVLQPV